MSGAGQLAQLGVAAEAAYGTYQAPSRFVPMRSESMTLTVERLESQAMRVQRLVRSTQWVPSNREVGGDASLELAAVGQGVLLRHAIGAVATAQPAAVAAPSVYQHTYTPGDLDDLSLTVQVGRPSLDGTVHPFSYLGCKVASWALACSVGEFVTLTPTFAGADETLAEPLAAPVYPEDDFGLTYIGGRIVIDGAEACVNSANLSGDNALKLDKRCIGSALRKQPVEVGWRSYSGDIDADFVDLALYNRFRNGTEAQLLLDFAGAPIEGGFNQRVEISANVRFEGGTPTVGGPDEIRQPLPFKVVDPGDGGFTVVQTTTDATP